MTPAEKQRAARRAGRLERHIRPFKGQERREQVLGIGDLAFDRRAAIQLFADGGKQAARRRIFRRVVKAHHIGAGLRVEQTFRLFCILVQDGKRVRERGDVAFQRALCHRIAAAFQRRAVRLTAERLLGEFHTAQGA